MNINRDYLIINDVKKSNIKLDNGSMFFYITDKNTQNIFVNLVINVSNNDLIQKYANIENAEDYTLTMNIVKPDNTYKIIEGKLHDKEKAIFEFDLNKDCCDEIGTYRCELLTKCNINGHEEITTSNKLTYKVKSSILNDLDNIVEAPEYPLVIQLFDKLSDIEQYEEDRRANELARQLAEEQRQARFNALDADMTDSIEAMDNKVIDVENRITAKEQAVDTLIVDTKADIDNYKVAKDQEIDEYKALKDTEINNAITNQDNKINTAISEQNDRIALVENNDVAQDNRLDVLENKDTLHESRLDVIEAKNTQQDSRLDIVENKNQQQDNRLDVVEAKNVEQDNRLNAIEAIDVAQNTRLDAIEVKNQQQDDRLLDIEKVNKRQDMNLKCLFAESKNNMIDIAEEGNSIYLQNSTTGYTLIDEIQGNTLVNCNKEPNKELILNGNINTSGDNTVTITEGVDGGKVDVALEGNTLVNVSKTKDSAAISKAYTVENSGNHIALQGDIDGICRPVITGNTLVNLVKSHSQWQGNTNPSGNIFNAYRRYSSDIGIQPNTTYTVIINNMSKYCTGYSIFQYTNSEGVSKTISYQLIDNKYFTINLTNISEPLKNLVIYQKYNNVEGNEIPDDNDEFYILEGDYSDKPIPDYFEGLQSSFEDNLVTQEMVDRGEEVADNLGKYKVEYKSTKADSTVGNIKTLYLNSPLLEGDTIEEKDGSIYHVHRSELVAYTEGDETSLITDKVNTLHQLEIPTYELIEQSNLAIPSYANGHLDFNTAIPVGKVDFLPFSEELTYLYANTQYKLQFVSDKAITADITLGGTELLAQSIVQGLNRISITTPKTLVDNKLVISGVGANISEVVVTDTDREFSYFEGMKSVGECEELEVKSGNKNLCKKDLVYAGKYMSTSGQLVDNSEQVGSDFIQVVGGQSIISNLSSNTYFKEFDINKKYIRTISNSYTFILSKHARYITFNLVSSDAWGWIKQNNIMINYGNTLQPYIEHQSNTQQLTHEPLRAVGDYRDRYVLIDGKWYIERKCGIKAYQEGDKDNYKTDLVNTVYPLEMPTYEEIDYNPLEVYSGTTHITTNSVIPTNITVKNHGFNCLLKPSTTYTISSNLGLNTVTTPSTLTEDCLRFMDTDTSDITTMKDVLVLEGDWSSKTDLIPAHFSGMESAFEQEYDVEKGKYKVNVKVANEDKFKENNITFYINEPLRSVGNIKDRIYVKDDKVIVERNCGVRAYEDGDFGAYPTDKVNTVYPLAEPVYEEVEYNDVKLFIESFKNSTLFYNSNVPVSSKLHYSYSVPIVDTVAQTASISDEQDVMIIDLATQVAVMEMMLM